MLRIKRLTQKQKNRLKEWSDKWIKIGLSTEEADWESFEKGALECYRFAGLKPVPIVRVQSPIVVAFASSISDLIINKNKPGVVRPAIKSAVYSAVASTVYSAVDSAVYSAVYSAIDSTVYSAVESAVESAVHSKKLAWHYWFGGQFWAYWQAYVTFFRDVCQWTPKGDILARINAYELAQKSACYWAPNKNFIIVSNRPEAIHLTNNRLHNEKDMAIKWRDGWGLYFLNGVEVTKEIVKTKAEELDPSIILKEKNAEVRREIVRKIGIERVCQKLKTKSLDIDGDYELMLLDLGDNRNRPYLKMRNPSIGTYHMEGIHPDCKTVEQALNWRNGTQEKPVVLT